jgi:DNA-binding FadR family transcriptional regulator
MAVAKKKEPIFVPLKRQRLSEEIYHQLKEAILSGQYRPGERLPSEKALCQAFSVGRAVIREAFRSLENSGLMHVRLGSAGGAFVKEIDYTTLADTLEGILRLNNVSLEDLTITRTAVETATFAIVLENITDADLETLEASIAEAREALAQGIKEPKNGAFHMALAGITKNRLLIGIIESLLELQKKFAHRYGFSYERKKRFVEEHQQVLELLKRREYKQAQRVFEEHIRNSICLFIPPS